MSSSDGFCSNIAFAPGELGQIYTGPVPTAHHPHHHPALAISATNSTQPSPIPTPTAATAPALTRLPSIAAAPSPSPTRHGRVQSPTRSNSTSSVATQSSYAQGQGQPGILNAPTPIIGNVPSVAAASSSFPSLTTGTPPMTPSSFVSAPSSMCGSVLGKRDASESEQEDNKNMAKKRRIAPTLVSDPAAP